MPNRILREGILTSDRVNQLGVQAELFYRRLMSIVDDFGRHSADVRLLRARCYPLRLNEVREADISRFLAEVQGAGLIALYAVDGKQYLELLDFRQQVRATRSQWPARPTGAGEAGDTQTLRAALPSRVACVADAQHVHTSDGDEVGDGDDTPPNPPSRGAERPEEGELPGLGSGDLRPKRTRTVGQAPPTVAEVTAYGAQLDPPLPESEAAVVHDYYSSKGWVVGRSPMRDWQAAVRGWHRRWLEQARPSQGGQAAAGPRPTQAARPTVWQLRQQLDAARERRAQLDSKIPGAHCAASDFLTPAELQERGELSSRIADLSQQIARGAA